MTATQLVNNLLYDKVFLASHTLAGGNSAKDSLDAEVVRAISGRFEFCICTTSVEIKRLMIRKLRSFSNSSFVIVLIIGS
jgi:hypothetical protein